MEIILTTLQLIVFSSYIGYIWIKFGVLEAISTSTYKLTDDARYLFLVMCWLLAGLNLGQGMEHWGVITAGGLLFLGLTIDYRENIAHGRLIHTVGAVTAILSAFIGLILLHNMLWLFLLFVTGSIGLYYITVNRTWWIEIYAFILILLGYYLR